MLHLDYRDARPIYTQIVDNFRSQIAAGILCDAVDDPKGMLKTLADTETAAWEAACTAVGVDFAELEFANWTAGVPYTAEDYAAL